MRTTTRHPAVTVEVFQASTGDYHAALCTRRGRLVWQSAAFQCAAAAKAAAESERTARYLRLFLGSDLPRGVSL